MKTNDIRSALSVRRFSWVSLFKIFFLGGAGLTVPFCALGLLISVISPSSVRLQEGQTMFQFVMVLTATVVLWPFFFAVFFGTAAWIAFAVKSYFSVTSVEFVGYSTQKEPISERSDSP